MGLCSSVQRNQETSMKHLGLSFESKTDNLVIPPSPIKDKPKNGNFLVHQSPLMSQWSPSRSTTTSTVTDYAHNGSKEEAFFDSKAWLDSDCEDDFYSVNGEFTPSRGTTPVHHSFGTPSEHMNNAGSVPEPSPTQKKKKLLELFRESVREDQNDDVGNICGYEKREEKPTTHDVVPKSARSTPYISGVNSACSSTERSMNDNYDDASIREKSVKSVQCCLPSLASCRSFSERKRKTSPAIAANGKA
ncbi:uncharacterized protein At3g27210 [Abrus precatorius]|uniref:Uncharacterized protein At3g27210 n=1 Tax=Abrus precatorius TaxID=3816 RepID=A0A8B8L597_ABRPR|nr:uncharacterized protein At3g27210 [Abrus precatorius]